MAKCFLSGVELPLDKTYLLDIAAAYKALKNLRGRAATVERLIEQLGIWDDVEIYDVKRREKIIRKDKRLVCASVAKALSEVYPEKEIFITWDEWRKRRSKVSNQNILFHGRDNKVKDDN